jgi:osmotically-inducible protein OsmY
MRRTDEHIKKDVVDQLFRDSRLAAAAIDAYEAALYTDGVTDVEEDLTVEEVY